MYQRILVPVDGSTTSERAVAEASGLAKLCNARIQLLHIVDMIEYFYGYETPHSYISQTRPYILTLAKQLLQNTRSELKGQGIPVDIELCESTGAQISDIVVDHAVRWKADLIVLGSHGRRGIDRILMGSDAERVARISPLPVLLVKPANMKNVTHPIGLRTIVCDEMQDAV